MYHATENNRKKPYNKSEVFKLIINIDINAF